MGNCLVHRSNGFFFNFKILDKRLNLSAKAIGLYVRIRALAENPDWEFSIQGIAAISKEGPDAVLSGVRELERIGLLIRERARSEAGLLKEAVWHVYEEPQERADLEEAPAPTKKDKPTQGEPTRENPVQADPGQIRELINYDNTKIKIQQVPPSPGSFQIPEELKSLEKQIRKFWTKDKNSQAKRTVLAWKIQMKWLLQILNDPMGGIKAVEEMLEKAATSAIVGTKWQAIRYDNWESYNKKHIKSAAQGAKGYNPPKAERPGPKIKKLTLEQLRELG